jgi:hypothetical protein
MQDAVLHNRIAASRQDANKLSSRVLFVVLSAIERLLEKHHQLPPLNFT